MLTRPTLLAGALAALTLSACGRPAADEQPAAAPAAAEAAPVAYAGPRVPAGTTIEVYKSPTCGCCKLWMDHLEQAGFTVVAHDTQDVESVKALMKVPGSIASCHTALVNGIVVEGHVPIDVVAKLAMERPAGVKGVGVNGMPLGAAGMEGYGRRDPFDVETWDAKGQVKVLTHVAGS
ncbi:MAG TPA: DUF411 domain-containing protein [Gemmatimonadaceae bacterium]